MTAYLHTTGYVRAEPRVRLNPGNSGPFAVVDLAEDGLSDITVHTVTEARALADAFMKAARLLLDGDEGGTP